MSISKIREDARRALTGKWGKGALITLAYLAFFLLLEYITGIIGGVAGEDSLVVNLLSIVIVIIQVPVVFGLAYAFIKLKRDEEVKAFDFLNMGFSNFGRAWKIGLRTLLKLILPLICMIVVIVLFIGATIYLTASTIVGGTGEVSLGLMVVALVGYVVVLIWFAVASLLYSLTTYIAYDNPNMTALEVVNESKRMMKGNRGKIFLLELSFIGWAILAVCTLGIGFLWLLPYIQVAEVCFYEYLLGKKEDNNTQNDDNNNDEITEF